LLPSFAIEGIAICRPTFSLPDYLLAKACFCLLLLLCFSPVVSAIEDVSLTLDTIETEGFSAREFSIQLDWQNLLHPNLSISASIINSALMGQITDVQLRCHQANYLLDSVSCEHANLKGQHKDLGKIEADFKFLYHFQDGLLELAAKEINIAESKASVSYKKTSGDWTGNLKLQEVMLLQLQKLLTQHPLAEDYFQAFFQEHKFTSGAVDLSIVAKGRDDLVNEFSIEGQLSNLGLDGNNVFEEVSAAISIAGNLLNKQNSENWKFVFDTSIQQGAMYVVPGFKVLEDTPGFYLEIDNKPVVLHTVLQWDNTLNQLGVSELSFDHPATLIADINNAIINLNDFALDKIELAVSIPNLANAFSVYVQPLSLQTNFSDVEIAGAVDFQLGYAENEIRQFAIDLKDFFIDDTKSRFSISGASTDIRLAEGKVPITSNLSWDGMSLYRLDLGPGDIQFESTGNQIKVVKWQNVEILDGELLIDHFSLKNLGTSDFELNLNGLLTPISMQAFTQAVGWPLLSGKLSSVVSGLKYHNNRLELDGDIAFRVFDGDITLRELQIDEVFSEFSILNADIEISGLDLELLSDTFSFGKIEGSLNGKMGKLKLENWQPVYFEAEFASPDNDDRPHRISQKALENLNQIGGGLSGTLSNSFLKFLPSYSYGQIGIGCRLFNGICELGGVKKTVDGFYILTRGGLFPPWVEVKGTGRSIKWDDLIGGLKQIAEGEVSFE
jgi:hypothetical protein